MRAGVGIGRVGAARAGKRAKRDGGVAIEAKHVEREQAQAEQHRREEKEAALSREARRLREARELGARLEAERLALSLDDEADAGAGVVLPERKLYSRGDHPTCLTTGRKTGYARFPGWQIVGDDVSPQVLSRDATY
jgi:hypothetical protein